MAERWPRTCAELVGEVSEMTVKQRDRHLAKIKWLDELVDSVGASEFTGLTRAAVQDYHRKAARRRYLATLPKDQQPAGDWQWPVPDYVSGRSPSWKLRTLVVARATMPGRGAGGGRPWRKDQAASDVTDAAILRLRDQDHLSYEAIAAEVGISKSNVARRYKRLHIATQPQDG